MLALAMYAHDERLQADGRAELSPTAQRVQIQNA